MAMASQPVPPLSSYNSADVLVLVGGQLFRAHRCILSTNSGYFKSLLDADVGHASLSLPGLPSRAFSVLLDFMYSGHLATTGANIYEVLLCAQFLHMPRAIDLCKAYLIHQQQQQELNVNPANPTNPGSLHWLTVSPLAYKAWLADSIYTRCLDQVSFLQQPPANILRPIPTKRIIAPLLPVYRKEDEHPCGSSSEPFATEPPVSRMPLTRLDIHTKLNAGIPSFTWRRPDFSPAVAPPIEVSEKEQSKGNKESNAKKDDDESLPDDANKTCQLLALATTTVTATSNVVIDIACCDGPVQFQRVVNENYGLVCATKSASVPKPAQGDKTAECVKSTLDNSKENERRTECQASVSHADRSTSKFPQTSAHKNRPSLVDDSKIAESKFKLHPLSFTLQPPQTEASDELHDENSNTTSATNPVSTLTSATCHGHSSSEGSGWTDSDNDTREPTESDTCKIPANDDRLGGVIKTPGMTETPSTSAYHCVYCNHTFKSRYCYQKHKQRHINPKAFTGPLTKPKHKEPSAPLDLNVPFYPCKICGSKFPSYYFVHKHRKMCHCDESLWTDESTTSSIAQEKE